MLLWAVCEATAVAPVVVPPVPDPTVHVVPSLCPSDKRLTRCRLLLNTKGHHVASLGAFLKLSGGDGRFSHHETSSFHVDGPIQDSCLTFVHGDSRPLSEEISRVKYLSRDTAVEASWFFATRHDDAHDALVMQIAFYGGRKVKVSGSVWIYSTSLLGYESKISCESLSDVAKVPPGRNFATDPPVLSAEEILRIREAQDADIELRKQAHARAFQESSWARRSAEEAAAKARHEAERSAASRLVDESRARRAGEEAEGRKVREAARLKAREAAASAEVKRNDKIEDATKPVEALKVKEDEDLDKELEEEEEEKEVAAKKQSVGGGGGGVWQELAAVLWVLMWLGVAIVVLAAAYAAFRHLAGAPKKRF